MTRSLFLAAVCGAATLLATAPLSVSVSVSGQATKADCDFYWSQVSWCQVQKWSATRIDRCIEGMRRQTPQATYCPGPGLAPDNDRSTWEPPRLTISTRTTEVQQQQLELDADANTVGVCVKQCAGVANAAAAACQTIKCLGEATKAAAMCEKKCIVRPSSVTEEAEIAASSVDAPAINTKCSVDCQDKLARCKKAAGTDGVKVAQCLQPYNSCASACMRGAAAMAEEQSLGAAVVVPPSPRVQCSVDCQDKMARCKKAAGADGVKAAGCIQPYNSCVNACPRAGSMVGLIDFWPDGTCQNRCQNQAEDRNNPRSSSWYKKCLGSCPPCEKQCASLHRNNKDDLEFCEYECQREARRPEQNPKKLTETAPLAFAASTPVAGPSGQSCERMCIDMAESWEEKAWRTTECDAYAPGSKQSGTCSAYLHTQANGYLDLCQNCCSTLYKWTHECKLPSLPTTVPGTLAASAVPVAAQVTHTTEENDYQALGGVVFNYDHMFDRTPCDQCSRQCDDSEPCMVACVAQCRSSSSTSSSTSSVGETLTPREVCFGACNHEYFECRNSLNPFKNRAWCQKDLDDCTYKCPADPSPW